MRKKSRLTITLPKDLLRKIDSTIDGSSIRNRSHAIESLIKNSLKSPIDTAVVLAGRNKDIENPTLKIVNGKPLIVHTIEKISDVGIHNIVICGGSDNSIIKKALKPLLSLDIDIKYVTEKSLKGTGGAIKNIEKYIHGDNFLVIHGDVYTELNLDSFIAFHTQENTLATIAVKPRKNESSYGKVLIEGNQITDFLNETEVAGIDIINAGIYLFKSNIFPYLHKDNFKLETDIFPLLAKQDQLTAFIFQGMWFDISRDKDYQHAIDRINKQK